MPPRGKRFSRPARRWGFCARMPSRCSREERTLT
jgi:hypothetical protein